MQDRGWLLYSGELGWRGRPRFRGEVFGGEREFDADGFAIGERPVIGRSGPGVMFLGDSRTFGNGVATRDSFPEVVCRLLPAYRCWNLGLPGYSSFQGLAALRKHGARLNPDTVVFAFGFNDRRYVLSPSAVDSERQFWLLALQDRGRRLGRWLASVDYLLTRWRLEPGMPAVEIKTPSPLDLREVMARVPLEDFRRNLIAVARYCEERGKRLILLELGDNPAQTAELRRGLRLLRAGRRDDARTSLAAAVASENQFSDVARLKLAALAESGGIAAPAESPRTFRSIAGGYPVATDQEYRAVGREVARGLGVTLVAAGSLTDRHPEWFLDHCHFDARAHRVIAERLVAELRLVRPGRAAGTAKEEGKEIAERSTVRPE